MIKNIFLPEKIGDKLLFGKMIIGIDIQKHFIFATAVWAKGISQTVEKQVTMPVEGNDQDKTIDPHIKPLMEIKKLFGNVAYRTHIHSSHVFYKELVFPFTDYEKIKLVIKYEIESLLPFNRNDAVIDFIITHVDQQTNSAKVMAACVQKTYIASHLALLAAAGIAPETVTVDLFGIYGLYCQFPEQNGNGNTILLDIGMSSTKICFITQHAFKIVRVLQQGLGAALKKTVENSGNNPHDLFEKLIRFGFAAEQDAEIMLFKSAIKVIIEPIVFTINSYQSKLPNSIVHTVILYGVASRIDGFDSYLNELLHMPVHYFLMNSNQFLQLSNESTTSDMLYSIGSATTHKVNESFNLLKDSFAIKDNMLLLKQLFVGLFLTLLLLGTLVTVHLTQVHKLTDEIEQSKMEVIKALKEQFVKIPREENNIDEIIDQAQQAITAEKELWGAFSYANQSRYLHYLLELTEKIDKDMLGFELEKITIGEGILTLKAKVKDYEALKVLERELKSSKLFATIPPQDNPQFTMNIGLAPIEKEVS